MKFTLLVVGKTVEKHYITAIADYTERTRHYVVRHGGDSGAEEYQESEHGAAEGKGSGADSESVAAGRCGGTAGRAWQGVPLGGVRGMGGTENAYGEQAAGIYHRRTLRVCGCGV